MHAHGWHGVNRYNCADSNVGKLQTLNLTLCLTSARVPCVRKWLVGMTCRMHFISFHKWNVHRNTCCVCLFSARQFWEYVPLLAMLVCQGTLLIMSVSAPVAERLAQHSYANNAIVYQYMTWIITWSNCSHICVTNLSTYMWTRYVMWVCLCIWNLNVTVRYPIRCCSNIMLYCIV